MLIKEEPTDSVSKAVQIKQQNKTKRFLNRKILDEINFLKSKFLQHGKKIEAK